MTGTGPEGQVGDGADQGVDEGAPPAPLLKVEGLMKTYRSSSGGLLGRRRPLGTRQLEHLCEAQRKVAELALADNTARRARIDGRVLQADNQAVRVAFEKVLKIKE